MPTNVNLTIPDGAIDAASLKANAQIPSSKTVHRYRQVYNQAAGTDVVTETRILFIARAAGVWNSIEVFPAVAPTGGDKQFTVDVQKSSGGGAFATILSGVVTVNSSSADRTQQNAGINTTAIADGDVFEVIVTASGSTGTQGKDVSVTLDYDENAS